MLRDEVIKEHSGRDCSQLLFHINEAMSWESVRNLKHMKNTSFSPEYRSTNNVSEEIIELIENVRDVLTSFK